MATYYSPKNLLPVVTQASRLCVSAAAKTSAQKQRTGETFGPVYARRAAIKLVRTGMLCLLLWPQVCAAQTVTNVAVTNVAVWKQNEFGRTQKIYLAATNNVTNGWLFALAAFELAEFVTNETGRASLARQGIAASQSAVASDPKSGAGHYYLAMNYGQLARAEAPSLTAYRLVHEVEREFKAAADLDETFDHAGPARNLGALYFQAPGWPWSVGSKKKARECFQRAAALAPDYPENHINLAEAHIKWHERAEAEKAIKAVESLWPAVPTNFPGVAWQSLRDEWRHRHEENRANFKKIFKSEP
jgi:tetratricopeptide (TPR) repeat protein